MSTTPPEDDPEQPLHDAPPRAAESSAPIASQGRRQLILIGVGLALAAIVAFVAVRFLAGGDGDDPGPAATPTSTMGDEAGESAWQVCVASANMRSGPGTEHEVVGALVRGDEILALPEQDGWVQLVGSEAYVASELLCDG